MQHRVYGLMNGKQMNGLIAVQRQKEYMVLEGLEGQFMGAFLLRTIDQMEGAKRFYGNLIFDSILLTKLTIDIHPF